MEQPFVVGSVEAATGAVPQVSSSLTWADHLGTIKARWGAGRMSYKINPGLYALGNPDADSPVLVSANYKMSFDRLREALPGRDAWILVLDTKGINVWCAAGKGTFGTSELVNRIQSSNLSRIVSHRKLILPQLAAPGVAAHLVKKLSGFAVIYGPIEARDLPVFLAGGMKATSEMRHKTFTLWERFVLIPVEFVIAMKKAIIIMPILVLVTGFLRPGNFWTNASDYGLYSALALFIGLLAGTVLTPLLLPWLPGRAFAVKGFGIGFLSALGWALLRFRMWDTWTGRLETVAWLLIIPAVAAYLAMNFTGASTYTSLSGVKKEIRLALPFQIGACVLGLLIWFGALFGVMGG
jgi:acetyl-CoA decarbonylase/synthase complex subunit gamma